MVNQKNNTFWSAWVNKVKDIDFIHEFFTGEAMIYSTILTQEIQNFRGRLPELAASFYVSNEIFFGFLLGIQPLVKYNLKKLNHKDHISVELNFKELYEHLEGKPDNEHLLNLFNKLRLEKKIDNLVKNPPQIASLREHVLGKSARKRIANEKADKYTRPDHIVFLSLCDGKECAKVVKGIGSTLEDAWVETEKNARVAIREANMDLVWAKADVVTSAEEIQTTDLNRQMVSVAKSPYYLRKGIAFDQKFDIAFTESEMNGSRLYKYYTDKQIKNKEIDYESVRLHRRNINNYLKTHHPDYPQIKKTPPTVIAFETVAFFCDEKGDVCDLYGGAGVNAGRRAIMELNATMAHEKMISASKYLCDMIKPSGEFVYGYHPLTGVEIDSYNILRHAGSIWSLINLYRVTKDEAIVTKIDSAISYLLSEHLIHKTPETAYILEKKVNELKIGGNGLAVIMLTEYMTVFGTDRYLEVIRHLANGILELQDSDTGTFYHVLNYPDFSRKEEFRTIYYDGEAAFALVRTYTFTKEKKYLDAAALAVENFIAKNYVQYRDHWVAYSLEEITQYLPKPHYYEFALRNAVENFGRIQRLKTTHPTCLELLMSAWQTYRRMIEDGIDVEYARTLNVTRFAEMVYHQTFHLLNAFCYPEYAMYTKHPDRYVGSVFIRHDRFRIRIDDMQHFISGFYFYSLHYKDIRKHLTDWYVKVVGE